MCVLVVLFYFVSLFGFGCFSVLRSGLSVLFCVFSGFSLCFLWEAFSG